MRQKNYCNLLPDSVKIQETSSFTPSAEALLDLVQITEKLKSAGFDVARLLQAPGYASGMLHRHSWVESGFRASVSDLNACPTEVDSVNSSPGLQKVSFYKQSVYSDGITDVLSCHEFIY